MHHVNDQSMAVGVIGQAGTAILVYLKETGNVTTHHVILGGEVMSSAKLD